jgi:hypothetical protein
MHFGGLKAGAQHLETVAGMAAKEGLCHLARGGIMHAEREHTGFPLGHGDSPPKKPLRRVFAR